MSADRSAVRRQLSGAHGGMILPNSAPVVLPSALKSHPGPERYLSTRVGERPVTHRDDPIGGVSPIDGLILRLVLVSHEIEQERIRDALEAAALKAVQAEAGRPREDRLSSMSKREHLNVADAKGRRHGRTYGPARGGWIPVHWADGVREMVRSDSLLIRFTVQSVGYVPKAERDRLAAEAAAQDAAVSA